jgi:hypothetical protein
MQVLACIVGHPGAMFKFDFADFPHTHEHAHPRHRPAPRGRAPAMMAPVIILGAIMMLVFWDTSEHR